MVEVRQAVDNGDGGLLVQLLQRRVAVHSCQDNITESREDPEEEEEEEITCTHWAAVHILDDEGE